MWSVVLFNIFLASISTAAFDPTTHANWKLLDHMRCGNRQDDRIIGGRDAELGEQPWLARVGYASAKEPTTSFRCGGSILDKRTILTAAHCVHNLPGLFVTAVAVGEHNTATNPDCQGTVCADPVQIIKVKQVISHSGYNKPPLQHDIALIRLKEDMKLNDWVIPICMIKGELLTKDHEKDLTEVAGWGVFNLSQPVEGSVILQTVDLVVANQASCQELYKKHAPIGPTQLCVGGTIGKDSCRGDSGGPLMMKANLDGLPRTYQIGIVSFGSNSCGNTTLPGVYSRMSTYIEWVLDNLAENKKEFFVEKLQS